MKPEGLAERLTLGCRILAEQEIIDGYGHLSARLPGHEGLFMINRHMSPALVEPDCFIVMDVDGHVVSGDGHPNNEWPIHARIYAARPDVGCVLHSHNKISRIFSLSPHKLRGMLTSSAPDWQGGLPVYRGAGLIMNKELGDALASVLANNSAALLRGHGDVIVDRAIDGTVMKAVTLKINAEVYHGVLQQGGDADLWNDEELGQWRTGREQTAAVVQNNALPNRAYEYYEARVNGRLARLLHPELGSGG